MHKFFHPDYPPEHFDYDEPCDNCSASIPIVIDWNEQTCYEITCPVCGHKMMLCSLCHWDDENSDDPVGCDWSPANGCHRKVVQS